MTLEDKIGRGQFGIVIKAVGYYPSTDEHVPYALKVFKESMLNTTVNNA